MLEKKKGIRKITLRIIGLVEADFNSYLKHKYAGDLMHRAEENETLSDEQWGLQKNGTSTDAALTRQMTYE